MDETPVETTLYSLSDAPPSPGERRGDDRHMTLFRVGSIVLGDRRELCLIKNISAGGMMIRAYCDIPEGSPLSVELKSGHPVSGRASWTRDGTVGVAFDEIVDVVEILSSSMEGPRPRMPRIEVDCHASVREGSRIHRMRVRDISQGGLKVESAEILNHGCDLTVSLPGLGSHASTLRWSQGNHLGITFNRLIPLPQLVAWLQAMRQELRAAG